MDAKGANKMNYYVGIDIGGTDIKYGLVNEKAEMIKKGKMQTKKNGEEIIQQITSIVDEFSKEKEISSVGISVPGIVEKNGFLKTAGSIKDFYGMNLVEKLEKALPIPVHVENDVNCVALAEKWNGRGKDLTYFICVAVGTGIGGAIVIKNDIVRGSHFMAGEFGFLLVDQIKNHQTRPATFSLKASVKTGLVDGYVTLVDKEDNDSQSINGEIVFQKAEAGDVKALQALDSFYNYLSIGLFNLAVALDPEKILIGGAISNNKKFITQLNQKIQQIKEGHEDLKELMLPEIVPCFYNNDAGIIGAVYHSINTKKEKEDV